MTNEQIAEIIADTTFNPKLNENSSDYAVQLMVEKLLIPIDTENYTKEDVKKSILWELNLMDGISTKE